MYVRRRLCECVPGRPETPVVRWSGRSPVDERLCCLEKVGDREGIIERLPRGYPLRRQTSAVGTVLASWRAVIMHGQCVRETFYGRSY